MSAAVFKFLFLQTNLYVTFAPFTRIKTVDFTIVLINSKREFSASYIFKKGVVIFLF